MGASVLKRLLITLIAVAFIGANLSVSCAGEPLMHGTAAMTAVMDIPCSDCPDNAPVSDLVKMACGALACAGIVGLPARQMIALPGPAKFLHPPGEVDEMTGISLKPDPFPPRPTVRV